MRKNFLFTLMLSIIAFSWAATSIAAPKIPLYRQKFIKSFVEVANKANQAVLKKRSRINALRNSYLKYKELSRRDTAWVQKIADDYGVKDFKITNQKLWRELLNRVDIIPVSLIIAQAACESDWGRSRFAKEGFNYFGQHCVVPGCGIIPKNRGKKQIYEIRRFPNLLSSVQSYMNNLNTHAAYAYLRKIRAKLRTSGKKIQGRILTQGLIKYSERRECYVAGLRKIIDYYNLQQYD